MSLFGLTSRSKGLLGAQLGTMGSLVLLLAMLTAAPLALAHGPVGLRVQEALPNDPKASSFQLIKGIDRTKEIVTFGLPFPPDTYFFETTQMLMLLNGKGVKDIQFHIERRWSTRRVKWLRVHMLMDLKANEKNDKLLLSSSSVPQDESKLLSEDGDHYVIKTGKATFWVNKKRFSLFDKVEINGKPMLSSTPQPGIVLTDKDGNKYESALDDKVTYTVEDNGPVYVALIAKGKHKASDGKALLGFTIRMHFVKGKSRVKLDVSLRNASKDRLENVQFKSAELVLKTDWAKPSYLVRAHDGESKGDLTTDTAKLQLFQGENAFPTVQDKGYDKQYWPTGISGYKLTLDGKELKAGGRDDYIQLFYAQSRASDGRAVMAGTRFAAGHWPQALGLDGDGTIRIGVFPTGNDKLYTIRFGSHITRECVLYFEEKAADSPRDEFFRFQYPLVGKPAFAEWFNTEGMFIWRLVSFKEEANYYQIKGWPVDDRADATLKRRPSFAVVRHLDRSQRDPIHRFSQGMIHGLNFLREDELYGGAYYLMAEQWAQYNADHAIHRSDDYNDADVAKAAPGLLDKDGNPKPYTALPGADQLPPTSPLWRPNNHHSYGLAWWSLTSGNKRQLAAYYDWGETLLRLKHDPDDPLSLAWRIFHLAQFASVTSIKDYQKRAWELTKQVAVDKQAEPGKSSGSHPLRGYYLPASQASQPEPSLSTYLLGGPLTWAYGLLANHTESLPDQVDQMRDLLEGMADFASHELWYQAADTPGDMGLPAAYVPTKTGADPRQSPSWSGGLNDGFAALYFGYVLSCDKRYIEKADLLLKAAAYNPIKTYWFQDRPTRHMMQDVIQKPDQYFLWHPLKINVERKGSEATLSWSKPEFAREYRIKYADKTIVGSLGYDPKTGKYEHDPKDHIPFWAATNVDNEPGGGDVDPGKTQQLVIKGLDPAKTYDFAGRFLSQELCGKTTEDLEKPASNETTSESIQRDGGSTEGQPEQGGGGCDCASTETNGASLCLLLLLLGAFLMGQRSRERNSLPRES